MDEALRECVRKLAGRTEPAPLVPRKAWDAELGAAIERLLPDSDPLKSALHLWNDNLVRAHEIAQEIGTSTGSYLHGVMHRREPDYGNSKYWFHKVGRHPNFAALRAFALELLSTRFAELAEIREAVGKSGDWDPFRMVDWCESAEGKDDPFALFLRTIQAREIGLLASQERAAIS